jgi:hypothetical protein
MQVIPPQLLCTDAALFEAFRHHLVDRDLPPATIAPICRIFSGFIWRDECA